MAILAMHLTPSLTQEKYDEVVRRLTGKDRLESVGDLPFEGILAHATAQTPDGFVVFDIFESEEAVQRFREAVASIAPEVGIEQPPHFYPAHSWVVAGR